MGRHCADCTAVRMILPAWCNHLEESFFLYKDVQFNKIFLPVKTSCLFAETVIKPLDFYVCSCSLKSMIKIMTMGDSDATQTHEGNGGRFHPSSTS